MRYVFDTAKPKSPKYEVNGRSVLFVDSSEKIERVQRMLKDSTRVGVDTEYGARGGGTLKDVHPYGKAWMVSMQFTCAGPKLRNVHDAEYIFVPNWDKYTNTFRHFKEFLEDSTEKKVLHQYKADAHVFANHGIKFQGLKSDTMVKAALRNNIELKGLKEQTEMHLGINTKTFREVFTLTRILKNGKLGKQKYLPSLFDVVNGSLDERYGGKGSGVKRLVEYAVKDPSYTLMMDDFYDKELSNTEWGRGLSMLDYYKQLDHPFVQALFKIERRGCMMNKNFLEEIRDSMVNRVIELEQEFFHLCVKKGITPQELEDLNMGSPTQIGTLFTRIGMDLPKTPTGKAATGDDALSSIKSARFRPIIKAYQEWASIEKKLLGTYIRPWIGLTDDEDGDGMLRCEYNFPGTVTGRLSSRNPNLQNIPRAGEDQADPFGMRKAFVAPKGYSFGDADLSQIEIRLMAHFTKDPIMLQALKNDWDLHARTALICYPEVQDYAKGKKLDGDLLKAIKKVFPDQRQASKTVNFMIGYGGGAGRYAEETGKSILEGKRVIAEFFRAYAGLAAGIDKVRRYCRKHGYVKTLLQKRLYVEGIHSHETWERARAERQAFNFVVQGSAAELLKMTMVLIDRDPKLEEWDVSMRIQIHDELGFYVPDGRQKGAKPIIDKYMSHPYRYFGMKDLLCDTPGDVEYGDNWLTAKAA
jgi:DNA polymerase-1